MKARYQKVGWKRASKGQPVVLYSEVSDQGVETRKVDEYRDGRLDFADASRSSGTTFLSEKAMPSIADIARQPEFTAMEIRQGEFEEVWRRATTDRQSRQRVSLIALPTAR